MCSGIRRHPPEGLFERPVYSDRMPPFPGIVAHLIVGRREEPYLGATLASIGSACALAIVNDNSGVTPGPNDRALATSELSRTGRLRVVRTAFSGFGDARNACIDATPDAFRNGWALFVDADEIHDDELLDIASLLVRLPAGVDAVDGYSRHFVGSFRWWFSLERRLCCFRLGGPIRWQGAIHERLVNVRKRIALPAAWPHYGHVVTPRMEWEKSRLYSSLGQPGFSPTDSQLEAVDASQAWGRFRRDVLPFEGVHPAAALPTIERLSREWAATFEDVDRLFSRSSPLDRIRNRFRGANFSRLLALRAVEAGARWGYPA
jgi:hypothetical protein